MGNIEADVSTCNTGGCGSDQEKKSSLPET
jgi:hypothetical protein